MPPADVAVATEYILIKPQTTFVDSVSKTGLEELRREVILQAQGEAVELFDDMSPLVSALTLAAIFDVATEAVLRLSDDRLILLFDHQTKQQLRPDNVDTSLWEDLSKAKNKLTLVANIATPKTEATFDLEAIWHETADSSDIIERTKILINTFAKMLQPATTIILTDNLPILPLLASIYLARSSAHRIIFSEPKCGNVTLFTIF